MIALSYTELLALRDEAVAITKFSRSPLARACANRIIAMVDAALERRKRQVAKELGG